MAIHHDDRVLVTGAASGLGLALVEELLDRGCRVLATDVQDPVPESMSGRAKLLYRRLDVRSDEDWAAALAWVEASWNGLDLLFNNAGVAAGGRIELTDMDQWQWIVDINLLGVVRGCRTFAPMLKAQRSGHVVNTASAAGLVHPPRMSELQHRQGRCRGTQRDAHPRAQAVRDRRLGGVPDLLQDQPQQLRGNDPESRAAAGKLIDGARVSAAEIAVEVLKGVDAGRPSS